MKVLDYLFVSCLTIFFSSFAKTTVGQSVDLLLSSDNNCGQLLEVGIYIRATQFSAFDFEIGSSSIFLDYDPKVVHYASYIENEFSVDMGNSSGWLAHELSFDNECGLLNLVLELEDPTLNHIYLSRQQAIKIGVVNFEIIDSATDPDISVRADFTSVFGAGSNDGTSPIPILNIPRVVDYSCIEDCDLSPGIVYLEVIDENCMENIGGFEMGFKENPNRDSIEISINGGFNYDYVAPVGANYAIENLSSGFYDLWVRWQNDQCPTSLGNYYIGSEGGPDVTVSLKSSCNINKPGDIVFEFTNQLPNIDYLKFSIDGGSSFSPAVADNTGSYAFENLSVGPYDCVVSWGDGSCLTNLGTIDVIPPDLPSLTVRQFGHCYSQQPLRGALFFDIIDHPLYTEVLISVDGGLSFPYLVNDDIGTFIIENFEEEAFTVRAKWPSIECSYYYGSGFFRYVPRAFDMGVEYSAEACENVSDGHINIVLNSNEMPKPRLSIDGGEMFYLPTEGQSVYQFTNRAPGQYPIYIHWGDCIEYHSIVTIKASNNCPNCFDGIKNGDEVYIDCGGTYCAPCDDCQTYLAINANEIDEDLLFQASDKIEIKGVVDQHIVLDIKASNELLLKPHFEVSINAIFTAYIEDCN